MAKAHQVEKAIENIRRAISAELRQVDSELKSASEGLGSREEVTPKGLEIVQQILLSLKIRQAALSQSSSMCETVTEVLKEKQTPEIAENIAIQPRLHENRFSSPPVRLLGTRLVVNNHSVQCSGDMAELKKLLELLELDDEEDFV